MYPPQDTELLKKQMEVLTCKAEVNFEDILSGIKISQNKYQHLCSVTCWKDVIHNENKQRYGYYWLGDG